MGYESDPFPSKPEFRNFSYLVKWIKYTSSLFNPPDIIPSWSNHRTILLVPGISLPLFTVHRQAGRKTSPLLSSAAYLCILLCGGAPLSPFPPLAMDTPTLFLPDVSLSSLWSVMPLYGGIASRPWASSLSPPKSRFHRVTPTVPPPCTLLSGPEPLLPSMLGHLLSPPTASKLCVGLGILPPNRCC